MHRKGDGGRRKLYLAGPLFSDAERGFNVELRAKLQEFFSVYLPQEDGGLLVQMIASGVPRVVAAQHVFETDVWAIRGCDILLIVLDGRTVDEGAAFELGFAAALGKLCYGLQTDPRRLLPVGNNPMIDQALVHIFPSVDALLSWCGRETRYSGSGSSRLE